MFVLKKSFVMVIKDFCRNLSKIKLSSFYVGFTWVAQRLYESSYNVEFPNIA